MGIGGIILAFYYGPIYTLVCLAYTPVMIGTIVIMGKSVKEA